VTPRAPSSPPQIPGFEHLSLLGSGGFADVFLYQQAMPRRRVAIKVLLAEVSDQRARQRFDDEANLMAQLSSHPFIVTVYQAGVATDGRPFLVMEYCPLPNLGARYKREPFSVAEALRTGIELAGAVETMHRAGILHRDIKPANVLVTEYRRPALTDFGISAVTGGQDAAQGLSIPWSPPEAFAEHATPGPAGDVYSLAATIYSLLAGRSPFEVPGGDNRQLALAGRIETMPLPALHRPDVPDSLERVLATAMDKSPNGRYPSVLALARALQQVQTQLQLPLTPVEVVDETAPPAPHDDEDDGGTRIRSVVTVDADGAGAPAATAPVVSAPRQPLGPPAVDVPADTVRGRPVRDFRGPGLERPAVETTLHRPGAEPSEADAPVGAGRRGNRVALGVGLVVLAAAATGGYLALHGRSGTPSAAPSDQAVAAPVDALGAPVPAPTAVQGAASAAGVAFTWGNPAPKPGDTYLYRVADPTTQAPYQHTDRTAATVPAAANGRTCLEVILRRSDGTASAQPGSGCVGP
jgi:tRNA A-37 threonylcarbamoyl transferase component Bud32